MSTVLRSPPSLHGVSLLTAAVLALATCTTEPAGPAPQPHVTFQLSAGWELIDDQPGYTSAVLEQPSKDGNAPHVTLETIPFGVFAGSESAARSRIQDQRDSEVSGEALPGWPDSEMQEVTLPSRHKLYAFIGPNNYWYSHGEAQGLSWGTVFAFSKGGYVLTFHLGDRADLYLDEIDLIAKTAEVTLE